MMERRYIHSNRLVFDLGMNNGDDTAYYLKKQLRVVAVDANPGATKEAETRFAHEIQAGRLTIHSIAIWQDYATQPFHIRSDHPYWSSLDVGWATRGDGVTEQVHVNCVPLRHLVALHGMPAYLKIDIEGADELVIDQLSELPYLPAYVSVEDCRFGFRYLEKLMALGYDAFKLSNQASVQDWVDKDIGHRFVSGSSGPMGEQVPGEWCSREGILQNYAERVRTRENERRSPPGVWWDIHARAPLGLAI